MSRPPQRFRRESSGAQRLFVATEFADAVRELGLLEPGALDGLLPVGDVAWGRGRNLVVALPRRPERLHLRSFRHGGWLAGFLGHWLPGPGRPLAELSANAQLHAAGAPVPRPVLVAAARRAPSLWSAAVGTIHVENSENAGEFLAKQPGPEQLLLAAHAAGRALRRFHDAGGRHADLHVGNLLICDDDGAPRVCIVDLDRARVTPMVPARRRMREIMRLQRSLVKRGFDTRGTQDAGSGFMDSYTAGDTALYAALLAQLPRERRRLALHRLGYPRRLKFP